MRRVYSKAYVIMVCLAISLSVSCVYAQEVLDNVDETYNNVATIEVEGSFCLVNVTGNSSSEVVFKGEILGSNKYDIEIKQELSGSTLKVWIEKPNSTWGNIKGKLEFRVPKNTNVIVKNSSGSVNVEDIGQSEVRLEASSGSIRARNIDSEVVASASSGSITLERIGGDVKASTSSGSQVIREVKGNLKSKATSGGIKAERIDGEVVSNTSSGSQSIEVVGSNLKAEATSGSLNIRDVTGDVDAGTSSGSIKLDKVTGSVKLSSSSGSQRGTSIKLTGDSYFKASSGSVTMDLLNDIDELSFDLTASSGGLSAKGVAGKKNLVVDRGPIKIHGNTSSGSQNYR